jgi:hypothetical protein
MVVVEEGWLDPLIIEKKKEMISVNILFIYFLISSYKLIIRFINLRESHFFFKGKQLILIYKNRKRKFLQSQVNPEVTVT